MTTAIELANVSKIYRRYSGRQFATLKSALLQRSILRDLQPSETFPASTDVSFTVPKGSTYGVIGRNGSGKSTALKLVAGITKPTSGTVPCEGRISALIELGAGFHPEISGRENVFINGIMLGLTKREIQRALRRDRRVRRAAGVHRAPVKTYSSGMYMRLGFAVAIHVDPDVLLVDEVLAVGDEGFTHKCLDKFAEFRRRGKTILLVTHSLGLVERFCDEAVWLETGQRAAHGDPKRVVGAYLTDVEKGEEQLLAATTAKAAEASASGAGRAGDRSTGARPRVPRRTCSGDRRTLGITRNRDHRRRAPRRRTASRRSSSTPAIRCRFASRARARSRPTISSSASACSTPTASAATARTPISKRWNPQRLDGEADVTFAIDSLDLVEGTYKLDVAVHKRDGYPYDYHRLLYTFRVKSRTQDVGIYRPRHRWTFRRRHVQVSA